MVKYVVIVGVCLETKQKYHTKVLFQPEIQCNGAVTYKRIKVTDAERTENLQKNVYPVIEVVSVALNVEAEVVRRAYVPNK